MHNIQEARTSFILGVCWKDHVPNSVKLERTGSSDLNTILRDFFFSIDSRARLNSRQSGSISDGIVGLQINILALSARALEVKPS